MTMNEWMNEWMEIHLEWNGMNECQWMNDMNAMNEMNECHDLNGNAQWDLELVNEIPMKWMEFEWMRSRNKWMNDLEFEMNGMNEWMQL